MALSFNIRFFLTIVLCATALLISSLGNTDNESSFLRVRGDKVVDGEGNAVVLRGFNISLKDFRGVLGEADIQRIADTGANSIRLILDYRSLESSPFVYDPEGFSLLDSVVGWCEEYGVYVILDMHLAPGIQNPHDFVVHREGTYEFWKKGEYRERLYALWAEIAKRYSGRTVIAGYDVLNEGVPPTTKEYRRVMNSAARSIRAFDKNHMLIIEEAILPDGTKELVSIEDSNALYSIHFFYPPEFTFYTTTTERAITNYPGELVTCGEKISEAVTGSVKGNSGWTRLELEATPPPRAEILKVTISSERNDGTVWFDDLTLEKDGHPIDLPAPLVPNPSFEVNYPGISWNTHGQCVTVTEETARTGKCSLSFSRCTTLASAMSSPIEAKAGKYLLTAWVKSADATGSTHISLSWYRKKVSARVDRKTLSEKLRYAFAFKSRHHVPLYVGEFTAHANPSDESVVRYLSDLLGIMESEGLHWSYWTYYSEYPGIGICSGDKPRLVRPEGLDVLRRNMTRRESRPVGITFSRRAGI